MVSKKFASDLKGEVPSWVSEKIITKQQGDKLVAKYPDADHDVTSIVAIFGAILIGLGVLTFVATNWDAIAPIVRVLLLVAVTLGAYWGGYVLREKKGYPKVGEAVLLLGAIMVGVSIILIAQTYNMESNSGNWLLLWLIGIAPVAYMLASVPILALSLLVLSLWLATWFAQFAPGSWFGDGMWRIFEIWPLTATLFLAYGVLLWALGQLHEKWKPSFSPSYKIIGAIFILFNTYILTFRWFTDYFWTSSKFAEASPVLYGILAFGVITLAVLGFAIFKHKQDSKAAIALAVVLVIGLLLAAFPGVREGYRYEDFFTLRSLFMNVVFLALLVGTAWWGIAKREAYLVNFALIGFGVDVLTRYFEFFSDRLFGAAFFTITGVILLVAAISLERIRRKIMESMNTTPAKKAK